MHQPDFSNSYDLFVSFSFIDNNTFYDNFIHNLDHFVCYTLGGELHMQLELLDISNELDKINSALNLILTGIESEGTKKEFQEYKALSLIYDNLIGLKEKIDVMIEKSGCSNLNMEYD